MKRVFSRSAQFRAGAPIRQHLVHRCLAPSQLSSDFSHRLQDRRLIIPTHDLIDNRRERLVDHINRILSSPEAGRLSNLHSVAYS